MPIININGKQVHIDDDSHSAHVAAEFLSEHPDNANAFFDEAKRDLVNGVAHFELPHTAEHTDISHHFTLIHHTDGTYDLRKRIGY